MAIVGTQNRWSKTGRPVVAWIIALVFFFPIFWLILTSLKTNDGSTDPSQLLVFMPTLENYINLGSSGRGFWRFMINSILICSMSTFFTLFVAVPSAYAMAFNPSKRTKDVLVWMLSTKMLPAAAVLYPMKFIMGRRGLDLLDTHFLVIIVLGLINLPIVMWMLFTYFKEIPKEILEAGRMDGAGTWGEIKDIVMPLAWGGIASTALLCFIFCWNEAYWTVRLTTFDAQMLSGLIEQSKTGEGAKYASLAAASTAAVAPIVILGWFCQKQLVAGLTFGAVK